MVEETVVKPEEKSQGSTAPPPLTMEEIMGEHRETWCAVERMPAEDWARKVRKHYHQWNRSQIFGESGKKDYARVTEWPVKRDMRLKERAHYPHISNKSVIPVNYA